MNKLINVITSKPIMYLLIVGILLAILIYCIRPEFKPKKIYHLPNTMTTMSVEVHNL